MSNADHLQLHSVI